MSKKPIIYTALFTLNIVVLMLIFQFSKYSAIIFENRELHSTLEAISAVIALIMAWFLYRKRKEPNGGKYAVLALGFLAMGTILLFIATSIPGKGFLLLHNTKNFIVAFFFILIWFPRIQESVLKHKWFPLLAFILIYMIGHLEIFARDLFPQMVEGKVYTGFAVTINYLSSFLFIIASLYFAREYYRLKKTEDLLFGMIILLFFLHSLTAHNVHIWTLAWWSWHIVQIASVVIILTYVIRDYIHTRESLIISEKKYQQLFDKAPDGIIQIDSKANIIDCNHGECAMLGYERNEIIGKHVTEFLSTESKEISNTGFPILKKEGYFETELSVVRKDGITIPIWRRVNATYDNNRKFNGAIAHTHDITNRKKAEDRIHHLNRVLRTIRNVNQLITTDKRREVLIQRICEILINNRGYYNAWIVLLGKKREYLKYAESGFGKNFAPMKKMFEKGELPDCGINALGKKDIVITENPIKDCLDCPLSTNCSRMAVYTICLMHNNRIYGLLSVSASIKYIKDKKEQDLFKEIAGDISFALYNIEAVKKRKQAEELVKNSEERLKILFESAPDAYYLTDLKGVFLDGNKAAIDLIGYKREELIGKSFFKLKILSAKGILKASKLLLKNIQGKGTGPDEFILNRKDGNQIPVEISTYPVKIKNKIVVLGIARDITERKQSEDDLRTTKDYLDNLINHANAPIVVWNQEFIVTRFNHAFAHLTDYKADEVIGKKLSIFFPQTSRENSMNEIRQISNCGYWDSVEISIRRKNGDIRIVLWNSANIHAEDGTTIIATIAQGQDITNKKKAEEELKKHRDHLEELVQERTSQLEEANKELDSFSHSVSHDLRAPLRAIDGYTRILIEDNASKLDKEGKRLGSVIQSNTKKMNKLIDDLLDFSRLGRASMSFSNIDMKNMVNSMYHEVTDSEQRKRIKLTIGDLPNVAGDTNMMRQVWINLISNAIKFSSKRKQSIIAVSYNEDKDELVYCIKDNGAGFDMKYVDKLFGVFQRLHSEKDFEGTGVGLSLVKRVIHRHNGTIWAESKVDKGATFYFSLPKNSKNLEN